MSSGMPELGSKISLISKADIRYEGRLFTVDPQECTIALASVRSFGTEDRETQYPVAPQSQVYDYILFRGSDIKDIRVLNNVPSLPNDPAIVQMSVPPSLGTGGQGQYAGQYNHPVVGQTQYPQYHPMGGFPGSVHPQLNKTSELSPQTSVDLAQTQPQPVTAPIGSGVLHNNQVKDQGSMLDLIGGGSQQSASRSGTPAAVGHRKSPTADQGTQAGSVSGSTHRDTRRTSTGGPSKVGGGSSNTGAGSGPSRARPTSRTRQRQPTGSQGQQPGEHESLQQHPMQNYNRGGWRGRPRGRGRGFVPRNKNTLKFDNDYDFEQANTEFEELRSQLAKTKISDGEVKVEANTAFEELRSQLAKAKISDGEVKVEGEVDKKDDSGNETGAGEAELEDESGFTGYDKKKSFFDNISCEAVERSKGRSQRTDWRTERKLNSETFGVASARRGAWRPRAAWRHPHGHPPHPHAHAHGHPHGPHPHPHNMHPMSYFPSWRPMRGRGRPAPRRPAAPPVNTPAAPAPAPQPASAAAK